MTTPKETRQLTLSHASWKLLDEGTELSGSSPDAILESILQEMLLTDGGELVAKKENLAAIQKLLGENRG